MLIPLPLHSPDFALKLLGAICILILFVWIDLPTQTVLQLMAEGGPIESATIFAYLFAVALIWIARPADLKTDIAGSVVLLMFTAREMDMHKSIVGMSMLKIRFYMGDLPIAVKLQAIVILLPLILSLAYLIRRYAALLWQGVRKRQPVSITLATFLAVLVISKVTDRSLNILAEMTGYIAPDWMLALQLAFEESLELLLPVLVMVAITQGMARA